MSTASIAEELRVVVGGPSDYEYLKRFHYRQGDVGCFVRIFALRRQNARAGEKPAGVIGYVMPTAGCELRNTATGDFFKGFDRSTRLKLMNRTVRRIARVIVEPRYRGLGLASRLVRATMPRMNVPIIEAMAVMGAVNPFFEKAGMVRYKAAQSARVIRMLEAFSMVGAEGADLLDVELVRGKLERLSRSQIKFIETEFAEFLCGYGRGKIFDSSAERIAYILCSLASMSIY